MAKMGHSSYAVDAVPDCVIIGNYSSVAANVDWLIEGTHQAEVNHNCVFTTNWDQPPAPKGITIGHDVWIGRGAKIFDGVTIGNGAIIGAYTVVAKDVPPFAVVAGNPMWTIRIRFSAEQIDALNRIKWWEWKGANERKNDMTNITEFIKKYDK